MNLIIVFNLVLLIGPGDFTLSGMFKEFYDLIIKQIYLFRNMPKFL